MVPVLYKYCTFYFKIYIYYLDANLIDEETEVKSLRSQGLNF